MRGARRLTYADSRMKNLPLTLLHLAVMTVELCGPGGVRAVVAENLLLSINCSSCAVATGARRT